jgi:gliding motility-associated-like protein
MKNLFLSLALLLSVQMWSQEYPIGTASITDCGAFLVDDGYSSADYSANQNSVSTICSDGSEASNLVNLYFTVFDLGSGDVLNIYDGNSTSAALIGSYSGNDLQSVDVTASSGNGCLTVEFISNNDANVGNFSASISCGTPCVKPWAIATSSEASPIKLCVGETISFDGSTSTFGPGNAFASAVWDFGDGNTSTDWPSATHSFSEPGGYSIQLSITDDNGCTNANVIDLIAYVSTTPEVNISSSTNSECLGTEINLSADVTPTTWTNIPQADFGAALWVPDDQSGCFNHDLAFSHFTPGAVITDVSQIESLYLNFEHTFMGDLVITYICPNGQSIITHQQGGGGTSLGQPVGGTDGTPGSGFDYYWTPDATNGTWVDNAGANLPSGSYEPVQSFDNLIGCPLNGTWEIEVCDMWGADDGYIFDWQVNMDPALYADVISFTPEFDISCGNGEWSGQGIASAQIDCFDVLIEGATAGSNDYTFSVVDNFGCSYEEDITVTYIVGGACNNPPDAVNDDFNVNEDSITSLNVLQNDSDNDPGDAIVPGSVNILSNTSNGTLVVGGNGIINYTPNSNYFGPDSFVYEVCDTNGACSSASVTINVEQVNDAPNIVNDFFVVVEDQVTNLNILANDSDDGSLVLSSITTASGPSNGTIVLEANGSLTYTPAPGFFGNDSFTYNVCDDGNPELCDVALVSITVAPINDAPVVSDDLVSTNEDTTINIDVLNNDSDSDGNLLAAGMSIISAPSNGNVNINANGSITYTPNTNYFGTDIFVYEICDDGTPLPAACGEAEVRVEVLPVNDAPVLVDDLAEVNEDNSVIIEVLENDSDPDGNLDLTSLIITSFPVNGTAVVNMDGSITYTPAPNFNGNDAFNYQICDLGSPAPVICVEAGVDIVIQPVNDLPNAEDDLAEMDEDAGSINIDILSNDSDIDGNLLASGLNITEMPENGTITINPNGTVTYTPNENFNGEEIIEYQICDDGTPLPATCDEAELIITIHPVNDAPSVNNDTAVGTEDQLLMIDVLANDSDVEGELDIESMVITSFPSNGEVQINADGSITYAPFPNFNGADSFQYQVCDAGSPAPEICATADVNISIASVNDAPVADDEFAEMDEDGGSITIDILDGDSDIDGNLVLDNITFPTPASNGLLISNGDGTVTYTPNPNFFGTEIIEYQVCDDGTPLPGICTTGVITITVNPVNDAPELVDDSTTAWEDQPLVFDVLANDIEVDGEFDLSTMVITSNTSNGTLNIMPDGTVLYTPNTNFNGNDSFSYSICDDGTPLPGLCDEANALITVIPVNDPPLVLEDEAYTIVNANVNINVLQNDDDLEGNLVIESISILTPPQNGSLELNEDGSITYEPNQDWDGFDSFQYEVCDDGSPLPGACANAWVNIEVEDVFPNVNDDILTTNEDTELVHNIFGNDNDPNDNLDLSTFELLSNPVNGEMTIDENGLITYLPMADFHGEDQFEYQLCDSDGYCDQALVHITIVSVNDGIFAEDDHNITLEGTPCSGNFLWNDSDPDNDNFVINTDALTAPLHGLVSINDDGSYTYLPNAGYEGNDSFTYEICDDALDFMCASATVYIVVAENEFGENGAPIALDDIFVLELNGNVQGNVLNNDSDPEGDDVQLNTTPLLAPLYGFVNLNENGTFTYTPDPGFTGEDHFVYELCDGDEACASANVRLIVQPVFDLNDENLAPVANDDLFTGIEDEILTMDLLCNDYDLNANLDPSSINILTETVNGTLSTNEDGTLSYTAFEADFFGNDQFMYEVCDDGNPALCAQAMVYISIVEANDPLTVTHANLTLNNEDVFQGASLVTTEDTPLEICLTITDPDGDGIDFDFFNTSAISGTASEGISEADSCFMYTPGENFNGLDVMDLVVCDDYGLCQTIQLLIQVDPVNDAPTAMDDIALTDDNSILIIDALENDSDVDEGNLISITQVGEVSSGEISINQAGSLTYVPELGFCGIVNVNYTICDDQDPQLCDEATVTIEVIASDDDEDGLSDFYEGIELDTDGDGILDYLDTDSDNDGISDYTEAGYATLDLCNILSIDTDGDGNPNYLDLDSDGDTIPDAIEGSAVPQDSDLDGTPDYLDLDADGDGIPDSIEAGANGNVPLDVDSDGTPDFLDLDSDGDGIPDYIEAGNDPSDPLDTDGDGTYDFRDLDADGDGIPDEVEAGKDPENPLDTDGDGAADYVDLDADNDGIGDHIEAGEDPNNPVDTDENGVPNYQDLDSDGDGMPDNPNDVDSYTADCDEDGLVNILDPDPCFDHVSPPQGFSPNGDGFGDTWHIERLEDFPDASIVIYNRYGNIVYQEAPFSNDWNGEGNVGMAGQLPGGTYFYILDFAALGETVQGYVYISRNN